MTHNHIHKHESNHTHTHNCGIDSNHVNNKEFNSVNTEVEISSVSDSGPQDDSEPRTFWPIKRNKVVHHHNHGDMNHGSSNCSRHNMDTDAEHQHGAGFSYKKLLFVMIPFVFALLIMLYHFGVTNAITDWMMNPWWSFSLATVTVIVFWKDITVPFIDAVKKRRVSDISFLLSVSIVVTYVYSLVMMGIHYSDPSAFIEASMFAETVEIIAIVNIGYWINNTIEKRVKKTIVDTDKMFTKKALLLKGNKEVEVDVDTLKIGDIVVVRNGMKFPTDGIVTEGFTTVDEAMFTGESIPVNKNLKDTVYAATVSQGEKVLVKVTSLPSDSMLNKILSNIKNTQQQKSKVVSISSILEKTVIPFIFIVSFISLIVWSIIAGPAAGINVFATTLIVACPMVFVLLTPSASLMASAVAFRKQIILNSTDIFTKAKTIEAVVFDKTGTLTTGKLTVVDTDLSKKDLEIVMALEDISFHPVAKSIVSHYAEIKPINAKAKEIAGGGVEAKIGKDLYKFGSLKYVSGKTSVSEEKSKTDKRTSGSLISYLSKNNKIVGHIELKDEINETSIDMIKTLNKKGIETYMVTGDNKNTALHIAGILGIKKENVVAEVNPLEKQKEVEKLQQIYKGVAFVGDGINDAIALETADIGISAYQGSDLAASSADVTLNSHNNNLIPFVLDLSKRTSRTINFGFLVSVLWIVGIMLFSSVFYMQIAVLATIGPAIGAAAMVFNDVLPVAISSTILTMNFRKVKGNKKQA